jgi:hypothetical protein
MTAECVQKSSTRVDSEQEFHSRLVKVLSILPMNEIGSVTGPGRLVAVAAVYASHRLGCRSSLMVLAARCTWAKPKSSTLPGKAARRFERLNGDTPTHARLWQPVSRNHRAERFWYEAGKPQRYRHELAGAA